VSDDPGILKAAVDIRVGECGNLLDLEIRKSRAEVLALSQNCQPRKTGLKTLKADFLEQRPVVPNPLPPFGIVIVSVEFVSRTPPTTRLSIRLMNKSITVIDSHSALPVRLFP
jgi:hypothetical protein